MSTGLPNPFADPDEQYRMAASRLAELESTPFQPEVVERPRGSMLADAAPYLARALYGIGPAVLPGRSRQLANIGSVLAQGYLGARATAQERMFQDYDRRRSEAMERNESAKRSREAETRDARDTVRGAASELSRWRRESAVISPELAPFAPGYKAGDRAPATIYINALDAFNKSKEPKAGTTPKPADLNDHTVLMGRIEADKGLSDFRTVAQSYGRLLSVQAEPSAAGDMATIYSIMKMFDPNSVVRETEYATAQNAAGVPDRIRNTWNKLLSGERLAPEQRQDFVRQASRIYRSGLPMYESNIAKYRRLANKFGLDADAVIPDYTVKEPSTVNARTMFNEFMGGR